MKDNTLNNLQYKTIFTVLKTVVETITLDYQDNPEGFKIYYDADTLEPLHGVYWYQQLQPINYKETRLTDDEFKKVLEWRNTK